MSAFATGLQDGRLPGLTLRAAVGVMLAVAAGACVAYVPTQPQLMKAGLLLAVLVALGLLAARLPVSMLPLALVLGIVGLGNLQLSRVLFIPSLGYQEKWVLLVLTVLVLLGAALDASAGRRPAWPLTVLLGALFLATSVGSLLYAADRDLAWAGVMHQVVQMVGLAAGFFWIRSVRDVGALVGCLAVVGAVSAALGVWQFLTPEAFNGVFGGFTDPDMRSFMDYWALDIGRVGALWGHAPPFAAFLSALLPAFLYLWLRQTRVLGAWFGFAGFMLTTIALVLTGTRMEFIGAVAGVVVMLVAWGVRPNRLSRVRAGALPALVGALLVATLLSTQGPAESNVLSRLLYLFEDEARTSDSVSNRLAIYGTLGDNWRSNPILGVGLGNTRRAVEDVTTYNTSPHSYWLGLLAETGLVGTGLVALMLAAMIPHYRRLLRQAVGSGERAFAAFALAMSAALLVGGLADNAMLYVWQVGVLFWLAQGVVLSLSLRSEQALDGDIDTTESLGAEAANAG